jgi:hypothetical protein
MWGNLRSLNTNVDRKIRREQSGTAKIFVGDLLLTLAYCSATQPMHQPMHLKSFCSPSTETACVTQNQKGAERYCKDLCRGSSFDFRIIFCNTTNASTDASKITLFTVNRDSIPTLAHLPSTLLHVKATITAYLRGLNIYSFFSRFTIDRLHLLAHAFDGGLQPLLHRCFISLHKPSRRNHHEAARKPPADRDVEGGVAPSPGYDCCHQGRP